MGGDLAFWQWALGVAAAVAAAWGTMRNEGKHLKESMDKMQKSMNSSLEKLEQRITGAYIGLSKDEERIAAIEARCEERRRLSGD